MVLSNERRLVLFPEDHKRPRVREAMAFARETGQKGFSVKLFVEGIMAGNIARLSKEAGFPITCIENEKIEGPLDIAMFLTALHSLNAFRWSIAKPGNADYARFIQDAARSACFASNPSAGLPSGPVRVNPDAIRRYLVGGCDFTSSFMKNLGLMKAGELDAVMSAFDSQGSSPIPDSILELTLRLLTSIPLHVLDELASVLLPDILRFFPNGCRGSAYVIDGLHMPDFLKCLNPGCDPLEAREMLSRLESCLMALRELFMAYSIAREEFDYGVANVGLVHAMSAALCGTLSDAGIRIWENPMP